jgi:hypothetical protein
MANDHQPYVPDPDANMGDSPPSSPRFRPPHPGMSQVPPAYASSYPHPFAPQGDQGQGPPMHPPFTHLPAHVVRQSPYGPLPQSLQSPARMLPPGHNPYAAQGQPGGTYLQGYGQMPTPSAPSYHNIPAPHAVEGDDIPWAPGHGEVRRFVAPLADEQASQPPQAASPYPPAPGNPTGGGPQNMGAPQPSVRDLPPFALSHPGPRHVYTPQQLSPGIHAPQPPNASGSTHVDANGNVSCEPGCDTSTGCITSYNLINCRGCINSGNCVGCDGCITCNGCTDCYGCVHCVNCARCQGCVDCVDCVGLKGAIGKRGLRM